ncbi:MAG: 2-oxo acid dehydrogenase subunit E2 [Clostridia bacterium]|nr:2-oxo acid dehydrogenase subunit E2 [Clostridia bacterium]
MDTEVKAPQTDTSLENEPAKAPQKRKRRLGDRREGRRIRTLDGLHVAMPFIMETRADACNTFAEELNITSADEFVQNQLISGNEGFSMLHVILAAYVRTVAMYPYLNRFVSGQRIYSRNDIEVIMTVKKSMSLDAPETCIKVKFDPADTIFDVYDKFNVAVSSVNSGDDSETGTDKVSGFFRKFPRLLFRWTVRLINALDYWGLCPKALMDALPFWGSMIITSMGSLGIKPIYHHLYNFGNLPVFVSYGIKRRVTTLDHKGNVTTKKVIDMKVVTDERICDGYQYATAFKYWRKHIENPTLLTQPPETVNEDID